MSKRAPQHYGDKLTLTSDPNSPLYAQAVTEINQMSEPELAALERFAQSIIAARLRNLAGVQLLILDDWALEPLDAGARHDLYEILEERYGRRSTILTSQIPVDKWHAVIGEPTTS